MGRVFICTMIDEDGSHEFITSQNCASVTRSFLSPFKWVFVDGGKALPMSSYQVVFDCLRYWGMWFIWTMRNRFLFDGLRGLPQQPHRMKGKLS